MIRRGFWLAVAFSLGWWAYVLFNVLERRCGGAQGPIVLAAPTRRPIMPFHDGNATPRRFAAAHRRKADAGNRTLRTWLEGVAFTILTAVVLVLYPVLTAAHGWSDFHWSIIGFSLVQGAGTAVFAYLMRTVLDPSKIPTPLPPGDPGEPDADVEGFVDGGDSRPFHDGN